MLLNVLERRFVILGVLFPPQDFHLAVLLALTALVTLVLTTVVFGRIWCGWLCPQTVFMEMLFRKLEFLIEGSSEQQLRRDKAAWTAEKIVRRGFKHALFFALSFGMANVFLAWIVGAPELRRIVTDPPAQHITGLVAITMFSFVFYMVFMRFREQACVLACPYGRLMSALTDSRTITVTYDWRRGEPRGRLTKAVSGPDPAAPGDCVDCHQCVTVCPTGIDIRNGVQLECVNCTACIDACNGVMAKVGRPAGLIRLTSEDAVRTGRGRWVTPRAAAYATAWLLLAGTVGVLFAQRRDLDVLILRQPGTLYTSVPGGEVANFYSVQALNRTGRTAAFTIGVAEPKGSAVMPVGPLGSVEPFGLLERRLILRVPRERLAGMSTHVTFTVHTADGETQTIDSSFLGPAER